MADVFIVGVGMTPLGKHLDKSVKQLSAQAVDQALKDAAIDRGAIEAAWFCNTRQDESRPRRPDHGNNTLHHFDLV